MSPLPDQRHATIAAEARRLERTLRSLGPMPRHVLSATVRAERWRGGSFEAAVRAGVREGRLRQLGLGWVEAERR